ncbi:MAG: CooT family nickel-binding protein [archaeon]|nr:CooT family nickel-binding protein [archaeon]
MCEFTVYVDGHEDENIVAKNVIKAVVKPEYVSLMNTAGQIVKIPKARILKVDTIMTELILETVGE